MNRVIEEIKSRKLWQTMLVYCGGGFGLMQVVDILLNRLALAPVLFKVFLVFLIAGIPGSLIIAWFHGKEGKQRIEKTELVLHTILLVVALSLSYRIYTQEGGFSRSSSDEKSIAVLPFVDLSQNRDQEYFSDGLSEELLDLLAKVSNLKVICRTSSFSFKGMNVDARLIGEKLGVANLIEGSVRKSGNKLRITAQLIKTSDGSQRWSESYDRDMDDIFKVQDEIAGTVVQELKATLMDGKFTEGKGRRNTEAYDLLLQGRHILERGGGDNIAASIEIFKRALLVDSTDAEIWAELAIAYSQQADFGYTSTAEGYGHARSAALRALALNDKLAVAHGEMGWISLAYDWDWPGAESELRTALSLEPENVDLVRNMASLTGILGKPDDAIAMYKKSIVLDPVKFGDQTSFFFYVFQLIGTNRIGEAEAIIKRAIELDPQHVLLHAFLGLVDLAKNQPDSALAAAQNEPEPGFRLWGETLAYGGRGNHGRADDALKEFSTKFQNEEAYQVAEIYAYRGNSDKAFQWLERAFTQRDGGCLFIKFDPLMNKITGDPRFTAFLRKMKLPT